MKVPFKYYLHDDKESWYGELETALSDAGFSYDEIEEIHQRADMPFYEIGFNCELDTDDGTVTYTLIKEQL